MGQVCFTAISSNRACHHGLHCSHGPIVQWLGFGASTLPGSSTERSAVACCAFWECQHAAWHTPMWALPREREWGGGGGTRPWCWFVWQLQQQLGDKVWRIQNMSCAVGGAQKRLGQNNRGGGGGLPAFKCMPGAMLVGCRNTKHGATLMSEAICISMISLCMNRHICYLDHHTTEFLESTKRPPSRGSILPNCCKGVANTPQKGTRGQNVGGNARKKSNVVQKMIPNPQRIPIRAKSFPRNCPRHKMGQLLSRIKQSKKVKIPE